MVFFVLLIVVFILSCNLDDKPIMILSGCILFRSIFIGVTSSIFKIWVDRFYDDLARKDENVRKALDDIENIKYRNNWRW